MINGTIDLGLGLLPDTDSVFVVDGARENTSQVLTGIARQFEDCGDLTLVHLRDMPLRDVVNRVAAIPQRCILVFVQQTMRTQKQDVDQYEALAQIAQASPVPIFSRWEEFVGHGIVRGSIWRFEKGASPMADLARLRVNGARARDIPVRRSAYVNTLDWRELRRWHIPESRVPAGSIVLFRPRSYFGVNREEWLAVASSSVPNPRRSEASVQQRRGRRAEGEARSNADWQGGIVDMQSDLICRFLPDSTLTFVNDAYCRFWNKTREELLGRKFTELIPPSAREGVLDRIGRVRSGTDSHEHQVKLSDGTIGWHHWTNHAILDEHGRLIELQGVGRDITDRKRAEEALERAEAQNSAMVRAISDVMFVIQRDGIFVEYHAKHPGLLSVRPDDFLGRTIRDAMPAPLADRFMDAFERCFQINEPIVFEYQLSMPEIRHFEARLVQSGVDRALTIVRDVTESKRAMELSRLMAGRLIESQENERQRIARELHDNLSQKIAVLSMDVDLLAGFVSAGAPRTQLRRISEGVREIALDVRELSHELHPSKLRMLGLATAIGSLCRDLEQRHDLQISYTHDPLPDPIDPNVSLCLYRIAQEALNNVARHSHARASDVRLTYGDDWLMVQVADCGVGFDLQNAATSGLGLISMRERVAFLGGELAIHTSPGRGTRLGARIPLAPTTKRSTRSFREVNT